MQRTIYHQEELSIELVEIQVKKCIEFISWFYENDWLPFVAGITCFEHMLSISFGEVQVRIVIIIRMKTSYYYIEDNADRISFPVFKSFEALQKELNNPEVAYLCKNRLK